MSYNFDEHISDNNYNCPVVAYYPDLIAANIPALEGRHFIHPYFGLHRPKDFEKRAAVYFQKEFGIPKKETVAAARAAYQAYADYEADVRKTAQEYIDFARRNDCPIMVVAGRPYHMDPEINHGINDLVTGFRFVLITEDSVASGNGQTAPHRSQPVDIPRPYVQRRPLRLHPGGHGAHSAGQLRLRRGRHHR